MNSNILYILTIPENCDYENHFFQICKEVADESEAHFFVENDANNWAWDPVPKKVVYAHVTSSLTVDILRKALNRPACMNTLYKFFLIVPENLFQFPDVRKFYKSVIDYFTPVYLNCYVEELQEALEAGEEAKRIYHDYADDILANRMQTKPGFIEPLHVWEQAHERYKETVSVQLKQLKLMIDNLRSCVELLGSQIDMLEKQLN